MSLTKAAIIKKGAQETGLPKLKSEHTREGVLEIMQDDLASDVDTLLRGFGKFRIRDKSESPCRNPATIRNLIHSILYLYFDTMTPRLPG